MKRLILPATKARASVKARLMTMIDGLDGNTGYIVTITEQGEERTSPQNRLQQMWHSQAADQLKDETPHEKRRTVSNLPAGSCGWASHAGCPRLRRQRGSYTHGLSGLPELNRVDRS